MSALPFQQLQDQFAAHLRHPERNPAPPGVEERRLAVYRELFINNVEGAIASAFPVLRKLTADARWAELVRSFYDAHNAHTPLFHQLAKEFLDWYGESAAGLGEPLFAAELAHYEWVELALSLAEELPPTPLASDAPLLQTGLVKSALAWPLVYAFDVHRISPEHLPEAAPALPTCLVVYRDSEDNVRFMEINPVTARLLELLEDAPGSTGRELLQQVAQEMAHPQPEVVITEGEGLLRMLAERSVIGSY